MRKIFSLLAFCVLLMSCDFITGDHLIEDEQFREKIEARFNERRKEHLVKIKDQILTVFKEDITQEEKDALTFLYAYAPLSDLADYDGEFYLSNVRAALKTKDAFEWSSSVPDQVFLSYVLPVRVSNENLDNSKTVFFEELKTRIEGMSMMDAALEVNHWCHEKVTYKGTDARTMSPLNAVKTAYGRCGEESVFAVAAYRAVGIPARQIYTPRWAHSDDNHAWIEVWVDGKWYFTGACEPAPKMNMGWFSGPAGKGMLMIARQFGDLPESNFLSEFTGYFTYLNVTSNYTATSELEIEVVDKSGAAIADTDVDFLLYNYAELYPIKKAKTDQLGKCKVSLGLGDIVVWVTDGKTYTYKKLTVGEKLSHKIVLEQKPLSGYSFEFDMVPPVESVPYSVSVTAEEASINNERLKEENVIRGAYEATFITKEDAVQKSKELGLDAEVVSRLLISSRGNHKEILKFLEQISIKELRFAYLFLDALSYKDLWDTPADVLLSHFTESVEYDRSISKEFYVNNLMNPRVRNEIILPYKKELRDNFKGYDAVKLTNWIKENITISERENSSRTSISPLGTYKIRCCDARSRDIFFVAACRSIGIASKLDDATKKPLYYAGGDWVEVLFDGEEESKGKGTVILENNPKNPVVPVYYKHFTIGQLVNGKYTVLDFDKGKATLDFPEGIDLNNDVEIKLPEGSYMMITGNRLEDGSVLSGAKFFEVKANGKSTVSVDVRVDSKPLDILGKLNSSLSISKYEGGKLGEVSDYLGDNGTIFAWLESDKEPTKHFLRDMDKLKDRFEKWGGSIVMVTPKSKATDIFFNDLPQITTNTHFGVDDTVLSSIEGSTGESLVDQYPVILVVNRDGEILFLNKGYRIGLGEQLLKTLAKINR